MDGRILRERRLRYHLTQAEVARAAGMHQPDVAAVEAGRRSSPELLHRVETAIQRTARPSDGLTDELRASLRELVEQRGGTDIRVFGSVARNADHPGSDLDLMARFPPGFDFLALMSLERAAEDLLGIRVDVVSDDPRTPYALVHAKREAVPL